MAGLEEEASVERATAMESSAPQETTESALGAPSLRTNGQQSARGRGSNDSRDDLSRRWTRSQSPLRQLLSSASSSRSGSPKNGDHGQGNDRAMELNQADGQDTDATTKGCGGGGGGGGSVPPGVPPISSFDFVDETALTALAGAAVPGEPHHTLLSDDTGSTTLQHQQHHQQRRQQRQPQWQQQRVCLKNVLRPVSYDECHIPSEEGQAGGGGGSDRDDAGASGPEPSSGPAAST